MGSPSTTMLPAVHYSRHTSGHPLPPGPPQRRNWHNNEALPPKLHGGIPLKELRAATSLVNGQNTTPDHRCAGGYPTAHVVHRPQVRPWGQRRVASRNELVPLTSRPGSVSPAKFILGLERVFVGTAADSINPIKSWSKIFRCNSHGNST